MKRRIGELLLGKMGEVLRSLLGEEVGVGDLEEVDEEQAKNFLPDPYVRASISTKAGKVHLLFPTEAVAEMAGAILGGEGTGSFEEHLDALREVLGQAVGALEAELGERSFVGGVEAELSPLTELRGPLSGLKMKLRDKESMVFLYEDGREGQVTVRPVEFPALEGGEEEGKPRNLEALMDLELVISVELGRARMRIRDILQLGHGSIVELSKLAGEPVDLLVNGRKFAEGEVVVVDDNFGVRISSLVGPKERLGALS